MTIIRKLKNISHLFLAFIANVINLFPGRNLVIIGVTGTDGKTTTSSLIYHILTQSGIKTAIISTLGATIGKTSYQTGFHVTTPSPFSIQKYIRLAKKKGCTHIVLEVTSHALDQNRVYGINFDVGVVTNITHEHLDYHKTFKNYVNTKLKLLALSNVAVVNSSGEWFSSVKKVIADKNLRTYSLNGINQNDLTLPKLPFKLNTKLVGDFNYENILAAYLTARELGIDDEKISSAISSFTPPEGRQEVLNASPLVVVDFAHTPNSFEKILSTLKRQTKGSLIHVFGCAGERDRQKRPKMGKIASKYDDIIILTAEDPRGEKVFDINSEIKKGIVAGKKLLEIEDRKEAIEAAVKLARSEDTIVITGKGHERSMNLGHGEIDWSDKRIVLEILK